MIPCVVASKSGLSVCQSKRYRGDDTQYSGTVLLVLLGLRGIILALRSKTLETVRPTNPTASNATGLTVLCLPAITCHTITAYANQSEPSRCRPSSNWPKPTADNRLTLRPADRRKRLMARPMAGTTWSPSP